MLAGFAFNEVGALVMIVAYRYGKLSVLQPMLSLNYVVSIVLAALVLKEKSIWFKWYKRYVAKREPIYWRCFILFISYC